MLPGLSVGIANEGSGGIWWASKVLRRLQESAAGSKHQQGQEICCKLLGELGWLLRVVAVSSAIEDLAV